MLLVKDWISMLTMLLISTCPEILRVMYIELAELAGLAGQDKALLLLIGIFYLSRT
jgi:hypothetical protein